MGESYASTRSRCHIAINPVNSSDIIQDLLIAHYLLHFIHLSFLCILDRSHLSTTSPEEYYLLKDTKRVGEITTLQFTYQIRKSATTYN